MPEYTLPEIRTGRVESIEDLRWFEVGAIERARRDHIPAQTIDQPYCTLVLNALHPSLILSPMEYGIEWVGKF